MESPASTNDRITTSYTIASDALHEIAHTYFFQGNIKEAQHVLSTALHMLEGSEATAQDRLKLLLLYGKILVVDEVVYRSASDLMFSVIERAKYSAEAEQAQQDLAEALSLLAQAHCNATTISILKLGASPMSSHSQGKYQEALAYQQQALALQEKLHDIHGISESQFGIGLIYQFWQQHDLAREHFSKAIQVAEEAGLILEQAEPNRHLAFDAFTSGDLDKALTHAKNALSFRETSGFKPYQAWDHLLLKNIYLKKEDMAKAEFHMQQATACADEIGLTAVLFASISAVAG